MPVKPGREPRAHGLARAVLEEFAAAYLDLRL
jgi:hypothetical protein